MRSRWFVTMLLAAVLAVASSTPALASDASPCGPAHAASWSSAFVQDCPLSSPLAGNQIPVYQSPVAHAAGTPLPARSGYLQGTTGQSFVCQRRFPSAEYYHPSGWRNQVWAYTKSDDGKWGWVPEVFFAGGGDDESDAALGPCPLILPGGSAPPPKPTPAPACPDYYLMGLRGSGQLLDGPLDMGSTSGAIAQWAYGDLRFKHPGARISTYSVPYTAASVSEIFSTQDPNPFAASMQMGVHLLGSKITIVAGDCPHTRIGVVGYSQGAGVASRTMRALAPSVLSHVRGLILVADTDSGGATSYSTTYNFLDHQPADRLGHGIFITRRLPAGQPHADDVCFLQDAVCDMPNNIIQKAVIARFHYVHSHYADFTLSDGSRLVDVLGEELALMMDQ